MRIRSDMTDESVLEVIGARLARLRLDKNLTQSALAEQAGIGLRTLQRLESGASATQLSGFVRVCRVLGLVERFEVFVPEPIPSPMAQMKMRGRQRKRAAGKKVTGAAPTKWTWGESS